MTVGDFLEAKGQPMDRSSKAIVYYNVSSKAGVKALEDKYHKHAPTGPADHNYINIVPTLEKEGLMAFFVWCQARGLSRSIDNSPQIFQYPLNKRYKPNIRIFALYPLSYIP